MTKHRLTTKFEYNNKIIQKHGDARIYRECILLTPGCHTDGSVGIPTNYTSTELKKATKNWECNYLNVDHSWNVLDRIGHIKSPIYKKEALRADLYIYPYTQTSKDVISLIDNKLINSLSVELMSKDIWNSEDSKRYATNISFIGAAVVTFPADTNTRIIGDS